MDAVEVSSADIARIADVRPTAVSNWRKRHLDFPQPVGGTEKSPRFDLSDVLSWLRNQGKAVNLPTQQRIRQAIESAAEHTSLPVSLVHAGLALLYIDHPPSDRMADAWVDALSEAQATLVLDHPGLAAISEPDILAPTSKAMLQTALNDSDKLSRQETAVKLFRHYLVTDPPSSLATTPWRLAELMVQLAGSEAESLMDPACGTGSILVAAAKAGRSRVLGQDADPAMGMLTAMRLLIACHKNALATDIQLGDGLSRDAFGTAKTDSVVSHVPPSDRSWLSHLSPNDERWAFGLPSNRESELAWVQHALWHLKPGGTAVLVLASGAATRPSGRRIRRNLVREGALRSVVSLPRGSLHNTNAAPQLWLLRNIPNNNPSTVLMMDLSDHHENGSTQWDRITKHLIPVWHHYQEAWSNRLRRDDRARAVPVIEVLDEDVDLTPTKYLPVTLSPTKSSTELQTEHLQLLWQVGTMRKKLDKLAVEFSDMPTVTRWETIETLEQQDILRVWRYQGSDDIVQTTKSVRVMTPADIVRHQTPHVSTEVPDMAHAAIVRPGDVLAVIINRRLYARTAMEADIETHIGPQVVIIRPHAQLLDPHYLSGFLNGQIAAKQLARNATSSGIHTSSELRRIRMPIPDITTQHELAERLRQLEQLLNDARTTLQQTEMFTSEYRESLIERVASERTAAQVHQSGRFTTADGYELG